MRPLCLLLLFLVGCAGGIPAQYAQGVPVAPRPPVFSPTLDAPITVGQPGYVGPASRNYPRAPPGRVLPETPETRKVPGLWAANAPGQDVARVEVLATWIDLPSFDENPSLNPLGAMHCSDAIDGTVLDRPELDEAAQRLHSDDRACVAAILFHVCLQDLRATIEGHSDGGAEALSAALGDAAKAVSAKCANASQRKRMQPFVDRARPHIAKWKGAAH